MGSQISTIYNVLKDIISDYRTLDKRIDLSPGIPQLNESRPYWMFPNAAVARHGADKPLPSEVDVVIIGSGICGTAVARTLLEEADGASLKVVMLEARDACSGATGRNGGHACPNVYNEYGVLKEYHGFQGAIDILRFRLAHIETLIAVAKSENVLDACQARIVDDYDAFMEPEILEKAKAELDTFLKEVPKEMGQSFEVIEGAKRIEALQIASSIKGCIVKPGAALHPYRFVTGILSNLLTRYRSNFQLFTRTPCSDIRTDESGYIVVTPRGEIRTLHVIHATNAWSSHLLPGMRRKIVPIRAHMSAQRPGQGIMPSPKEPCDSSSNSTDSIDTTAESEVQSQDPSPTWAGSRAFVFYPSSTEDAAADYLTQLLPHDIARPNPFPTNGELMYGGGVMLGGLSEAAMLENLGVADDSATQFPVEAYLGGSLERYFGVHWGAEATGSDEGLDTKDPNDVVWGQGRVKSVWSGIIGMSADMQPWVGRVPKLASGRREPALVDTNATSGHGTSLKKTSSKATGKFLAAPGEWISAGFTGEGMVHAWLSGKAVARMIMGGRGLKIKTIGDNSKAKAKKGYEVFPNTVHKLSRSSTTTATSSSSNSSDFIRKVRTLDSNDMTLDEKAGCDDLDVPAAFLITEKRIRKAKIEDLMSRL